MLPLCAKCYILSNNIQTRGLKRGHTKERMCRMSKDSIFSVKSFLHLRDYCRADDVFYVGLPIYDTHRGYREGKEVLVVPCR